MSGTRLLMASSALFLGLVGLAATFLPVEILVYASAEPPAATGAAPLLIQLFGGLSIGFAMVNWMGRANPIGGIYSRPVALGNALHFTMGALALLKGVAAGATAAPALLLCASYALFSASFCFLLFRHPSSPSPSR